MIFQKTKRIGKAGSDSIGYAAKCHARSAGGNILVWFILLLSGAFLVLPLAFAVVNAFKPFDEIFIFPPRLYVVNPTWDNFTDLFVMCSNTWVPFTKYLFNSLYTTIAATVCMVVISSMCAYPLAKNEFPGKKWIFEIIVTALLFVPQVTFLPQYFIIAKLGMIDTYSAMILPVLGTTLGVFLMKQFMEQLPTALLEAARLDGYNEFQILFKIIMPNVKPAWMTLVIFTFQAVWNSNSSQYIFKEDLRTLPTLMSTIISGNTIARAGVGAAATVFLMIPPIVLFVISQSSVVQTMAYAGIKE